MARVSLWEDVGKDDGKDSGQDVPTSQGKRKQDVSGEPQSNKKDKNNASRKRRTLLILQQTIENFE